MRLYKIWYYTDKIKDINPEKLNTRLESMYSSYIIVNKIINKYRHLTNRDEFLSKVKAEMAKNKDSGLGMWLNFLNLDANKSGVQLLASFKDCIGIEHKLLIKDIYFGSRFIQFWYKLFKKRVVAYASDICVDGKSIINEHNDSFEPPDYWHRIDKFFVELSGDIIRNFKENGNVN